MDTPDKNRISAVSFRNVEDSPVFQYINDLSPIEPVKSFQANNIIQSLAFTSPSSLFSSPQINSSRFSIKRHRSPDHLSPVVILDETVKESLDAHEANKRSGLCEEEELKCSRLAQLENVSETNSFKEQISLAIELAKNERDCFHIQMVTCDEAPMDTENEIVRVGLINQSDELCRQLSNQPEFDEVVQTGEIEAEIRSGFADIENSKQQDPHIADSRLHSFASENVEDSGRSCSVQVSARGQEITLCSSSNVAAIDLTAKAEDKKETSLQISRKQRSVRRRCLTYDVGGSYKKIPLRDSTNDLPLDFTSINIVPSPQKCVYSSKQDDDKIDPIPQKLGLHLNALVNPSSDGNQLNFRDGPTPFPHDIEDELLTPVSAKRDLVSCDNNVMEKAPKNEISMEEECFDKDMPTNDGNSSQRLDELSSCKRCKCRKSKCLKLYCDCFAAGLYCVDPCSCQNCFNKPIHEDIVMKTRKEIEARNPLAFAPKVVPTSDSALDFGDEMSKTPASARHARGCNCKKSGCLKKYCECYLMGVGCSSSCRCIGCKNTFGHTNESYAGNTNEEANNNEDHNDAYSSQNEETSNDLERKNIHMMFPCSVRFLSSSSL